MADEHGYHHGDLPSALLGSVGALIAEGGVGAVSVRAVARHAGVSHAAPAHHFGDRGGLLAAFAAQGFRAFHDRFEEVLHGLDEDATVADALRALGAAYIAFGLQHPAWYGVMFRPELVDCDDPVLVADGGRAFAALVAVARGCHAVGTDDAVVMTTAVQAWSTVHGFVSLALDLPTMDRDYLPVVTQMADPVLDTLLAGMRTLPSWAGDGVAASTLPADLADPLVPIVAPVPA